MKLDLTDILAPVLDALTTARVLAAWVVIGVVGVSLAVAAYRWVQAGDR